MPLDWITISAQIVNFLILVYLLKRFLYRPVIRAMDRREQSIAERVRQADAAKEAAECATLSYAAMQASLEAERQQVLAQAQRESEQQRGVLLERLRREMEEKRAAWEAELARDRDVYMKDFTRMISREVISIARRTLRDLADRGLEQAVIRLFTDRIEADAARFVECFPATGSDWTVVTGFELGRDDRAMIVRRLGVLLPGRPAPRFRCDPDLICGIALEAEGRCWVWSVDGYLKALEDKVFAALSENQGAGSGARLARQTRA